MKAAVQQKVAQTNQIVGQKIATQKVKAIVKIQQGRKIVQEARQDHAQPKQNLAHSLIYKKERLNVFLFNLRLKTFYVIIQI